MSPSLVDGLPPAQLVQLLTTALGEPPDLPSGCGRLVAQCFESIQRRWDIFSVPERQCLCAYLMRFLASPRAPEELLYLDSFLNSGSCQCAQGPALLQRVTEHSEKSGEETERLVDIIHSIAIIVCTELEATSEVGRARRTWPTSLEQLLPWNPTEAVQTLGMWIYYLGWRGFEMTALAKLIALVLSMAHSHSLAGWFKTPALLTWIYLHVENFDSPTGVISREDIDGDPSVRALVVSALLLNQIQANLFEEELIWWLAGHPDFEIDALVRMLRKGISAFDAFMPTATPSVSGLRDTFVCVLGRLFVHMPEVMKRSGDRLPREVTHLVGYLTAETEPGARFFRIASALSWRRRCHGASCLIARDGSDARFRVCGGCRAAFYCSRRCQKDAWKFHREACRVYAVYHRTWQNRDEALLAFSRKFSDADVEAAHTSIQQLRAMQFQRLRA
jgi:hypothetical protein